MKPMKKQAKKIQIDCAACKILILKKLLFLSNSAINVSFLKMITDVLSLMQMILSDWKLVA